MAYPNQEIDILDTVQAAAADLTIVNSWFNIGNPLERKFTFDSCIAGKCFIQAPVTEVLQVTTLTPVADANTVYSIIIQQYDVANKSWITYTDTMTASSTDTAETICNYFRNNVNASGQLQITATGTTTCILTAVTGYPIFIVSITQVGGGFSQATGTAGVIAKNTQAALALQGITVTNASYSQVHVEYYSNNGDSLKGKNTLHSVYDLYINQASANRADLVTAFTQGLGNLILGGTDASIENAALI
jgi:hypothetical protein